MNKFLAWLCVRLKEIHSSPTPAKVQQLMDDIQTYWLNEESV